MRSVAAVVAGADLTGGCDYAVHCAPDVLPEGLVRDVRRQRIPGRPDGQSYMAHNSVKSQIP